MNRNVIIILCIVIGVTGLLVLGKHGSKPPANQVGDAGAPQPSAGDPPVGSVAPDFTLRSLSDADGKSVQLSSLRGKTVLVNFWATWCGPCKIEMPWFVELQKKYGPEGLQIVGVAEDDIGEKAISDFTHKMGINYPILLGTEKVAQLYGGLDGLPTTFFVDRSGKIIDRQLGLISESVIVDNIKKSLASGGNSTTASVQ